MNFVRQHISALLFPVMLMGVVGPAAAWTQHIDCEGGTVGSKLLENGANNFTSTFTYSMYSKDQAASGSQSCKMGINQGTDGWADWGAIYKFPSNLSAGQQLWIRVNLFVPTSFNYSGSPWLKFMRVHTASPSNNNKGYLDLYINPLNGKVWDPVAGADVSVPYTYYYEGKPITRVIGGARPTNNIATGKWESYEIHYVMDVTPKNAGGKGQIQIWKNNVLLADLPDQVTLADTTTFAESFFLFTYWNGNAPATQSLYVDDIILTTDTPANKDAKGNPFIGGGTFVAQKAPMPPVQVNIQ